MPPRFPVLPKPRASQLLPFRVSPPAFFLNIQTKGTSPNTPTVSSIVPLTKPTVSTLSLTDPIETDPVVSTDGRLGSSTTPSVSSADAVGRVVGTSTTNFSNKRPYGTTMIPLPLSVLRWTGSRAIRVGVKGILVIMYGREESSVQQNMS